MDTLIDKAFSHDHFPKYIKINGEKNKKEDWTERDNILYCVDNVHAIRFDKAGNLILFGVKQQ
jgi:hypothetical protein